MGKILLGDLERKAKETTHEKTFSGGTCEKGRVRVKDRRKPRREREKEGNLYSISVKYSK